MAESVKTIFKADNVPIEWEQIDVTGVESGDKHSEELFRESIASLKRNKLGLKGVYPLEFLQVATLTFSKVFYIPRWNGPDINLSTWRYGKNSTSMPQLSLSRISLATRRGTITWTCA